MNRDAIEALAALRTFAAESHDHAADPCGFCDRAHEAIAVLAKAVTPSRIQSAERAVVEAADRFARKLGGLCVLLPTGANVWADLEETTARLRSLRETAAAEECGQTGWAASRAGFVVHCLVRCHLPSGHEGEHECTLGAYRWNGGDRG